MMALSNPNTLNTQEHEMNSINERRIKKDLDSGMSRDAVVGKYANKRLTNTDAIRKVIQRYEWTKRFSK